MYQGVFLGGSAGHPRGVSRSRIYGVQLTNLLSYSVPAQTGGSAKPKSVPDLPISKLSTK